MIKNLLAKFADLDPKKKKMYVAITIAVAALIVAIIGVSIILGIQNRPMDPDSQQVININIEEGSSTTDIAYTLQENGLIRSVTAFKITSRIKGYDGKYMAGFYSLSPSMSTMEMIKAIVEGDVVNIFFTVAPGQSTEDIAANLENNGICSKDEFMKEVTTGKFDYEFMKYLPEGEYRMEGVLTPETYSFPIGVKAHDIVDTMLNQFNSNIKDDYYNKAKKLGLSFYDTIKVASIVEREASVEDERPLVSSVIYNRLEKGMRLQMCSTLSFILDDGRVNLTDADLAIDSPYNTYMYDGLPPTPIGNPGAASIEAAFNPADTDYLYFVLSEKLDGSSNFSADYNKFLQDKDNYYEAYNKENGGN